MKGIRIAQGIRAFYQMPIKSNWQFQNRWVQSSSSTTNAPPSIGNVPGLSAACIKPIQGELGPGASKSGQYKNPEYFAYHDTSYFEAEIEMAKYRCPQPSSKKRKQ